MDADTFLKIASEAIGARAAERDTESERSMARCVAAFNAMTGNTLSEREGWLFMVFLKLARAQNNGKGKPDDYVDGDAYVALAGESVFAFDNGKQA